MLGRPRARAVRNSSVKPRESQRKPSGETTAETDGLGRQQRRLTGLGRTTAETDGLERHQLRLTELGKTTAETDGLGRQQQRLTGWEDNSRD